MEYTYTHTTTEAGTGYFSCVPDASLSCDDCLLLLEKQPFDTFLHTYLLRAFLKKSHDELIQYVHAPAFQRGGALASLLYEVAQARGDASDLLSFLDVARAREMTPLPSIPEDADRAFWNSVIRKNRAWFSPIPPDVSAHAIPKAQEPLRFSKPESQGMRDETVPTLYRDASDALLEAGFITEREMRHEASLAPFALLRHWNLSLQVENGRNAYTLAGQATAYGRGLSLAQARLSCIMEIVERASSYVSVVDGTVCDRLNPLPLLSASTQDLAARGLAFLDPDRLPLETAARKAAYTWVWAQDPKGKEILVPAQTVFLFANFDEPELFRSGSSTGLASGTTLAQAKLSALLECIERDAEAVVPNARERVFELTSRDPALKSLLNAYAERSIQVQFQEKTTEFGIPVYQAFVREPNGCVRQAHACKLSAQAAVLAALTEVSWPCSFVGGSSSPTGPGFAGCPQVFLEDLPSCAMPAIEGVRLVEERLAAFGYTPLYVDVTREDLRIPVVRALVPGLMLSADCDVYARPPERFKERALAQNKSASL